MSDEDFEEFYFGPDETGDTVTWATGVAATLLLIQSASFPPASEDSENKHESALYAVLESLRVLIDSMPEALVAPAEILMAAGLHNEMEVERQVEELRKALEDL